MILYYDHKRRAVFREDEGNQSIEMSMAGARQAYESGQVVDCNLAFNRLASYDFDTDAVEQSYRDEE